MESRARAGLPTIREIEYRDCAVEIGLRCLSLCQKRDFLELFDHIYFVVFKGLVIGLFFLTYKGERFFPALHTMIGIFSVLACVAGARKYSGHKKKRAREKTGLLRRLFRCRNFFRQVFPCKNFFSLEISSWSAGHIFSEIPHTSLKVRNGRPLSLFVFAPFVSHTLLYLCSPLHFIALEVYMAGIYI